MARNNETPIRVGLLGAGTVGSQTARLIVEQKDELSARICLLYTSDAADEL